MAVIPVPAEDGVLTAAKKTAEGTAGEMAKGVDGGDKVTGTMYYISSWIKNTNSFRNLLNTSKGRDKFC